MILGLLGRTQRDVPPPPPPRRNTVVYSLSGLVCRDPPSRVAGATGSKDAVNILLEEMVSPAYPLADLFMILDALH